VSQKADANKILKKFNMTEAKGVSTTVSREESDNQKDVSGEVQYCEAVSSFTYLATATHPDIAFTVNKAARVMDRPAEKYWNKFKRTFRYLRSTSNYVLRSTRGSDELNVLIIMTPQEIRQLDVPPRALLLYLLTVQYFGQVDYKRQQPSRQQKP
jgi:hypothetical protein